MFQTNLRGVEAAGRDAVDEMVSSFRRTFVGLKHVESLGVGFVNEFQTNLRGVEAGGMPAVGETVTLFQTNLRGVEACPRDSGDLLRYSFQTNLRGVEAGATRGPGHRRGRVSDEPSWG